VGLLGLSLASPGSGRSCSSCLGQRLLLLLLAARGVLGGLALLCGEGLGLRGLLGFRRGLGGVALSLHIGQRKVGTHDAAHGLLVPLVLRHVVDDIHALQPPQGGTHRGGHAREVSAVGYT